MSKYIQQLVLWLAALAFGIQIGAALYEMMIITPLWTGHPPESVRTFNQVAGFAIQPLSYKVPAAIALAVVSSGLLCIGFGSRLRHAWALVAGCVGLIIAAATVLHAFPILRATLIHNGEGLTDDQIIEQVQGWILWSRTRLVLLFIAWLATIMALLQRYDRAQRLFKNELRWK